MNPVDLPPNFLTRILRGTLTKLDWIRYYDLYFEVMDQLACEVNVQHFEPPFMKLSTALAYYLCGK